MRAVFTWDAIDHRNRTYANEFYWDTEDCYSEAYSGDDCDNATVNLADYDRRIITVTWFGPGQHNPHYITVYSFEIQDRYRCPSNMFRAIIIELY